MAQQHLNLGTLPTGIGGDTPRTAFQKIEDNTTELYNRADAADLSIASVRSAVIGRNLLLNAEGRINQRSFAGGALAAGVYGYDRWKAGAGGCNVTIDSTGLFSHGSGPVVQVVEAPNGVFGQKVAFSVEDPSVPLTVTIGGVAGTIAAGAGRRGVVLDIPAGSGNLTVQLTATGATYRRPQLERGSTFGGFEYRSFGLDLGLCQRYYETRGLLFTLYTTAGSTIDQNISFTVEKRVAPTVTWPSASYGNASGINAAVADTGRIVARVTATGTGVVIFNGRWNADAEI